MTAIELIPVVEPGGIVLRVDGATVVEPGCCCDLASIASWGRALAACTWEEIWIGHHLRRLQAKADGPWRLFRWAPWASSDWSNVIAVPREEAARAFAAARREVERLLGRRAPATCTSSRRWSPC